MKPFVILAHDDDTGWNVEQLHVGQTRAESAAGAYRWLAAHSAGTWAVYDVEADVVMMYEGRDTASTHDVRNAYHAWLGEFREG